MMNLPFKIDLKNRVAVITGGGGVICSAFAKALALCGAAVAVLDLKKDASEKTADTVRIAGGRALAVQADVLNPDSLHEAEILVRKELGPCDILINGAGGNHPKGTTTKEYLTALDLAEKQKDVITFFDLEPEGVQFVFNLNFLGTLLSTQAFAGNMIGKNHSSIINISSMNAFSPLTRIPAYSAAKAAVSNFTQWLAVHFSRVGIRVNAIAPGFLLTDQNRSLLVNNDGSMTERAKKIISMTPLQRFGNPDDLIGTLLWLVDEKSSSFINGTVIPIDGGFSAYSGV